MSEIIKIEHSKSGAFAELYPYGATVTSFQTGSGRQMLFVSRDAKLDGSKAIRGGIPLVFPQFGQPDKSFPQHGFLRNNTWKVVADSQYDKEEAAGIDLELDLVDVVNGRGGKWDKETTELSCTIKLSLKIEAEGYSTILTIKNTGDKAFDFQTLFHTYYMVKESQALDGSACYVSGLEGYTIQDKITGESGAVLGSDPVIITGVTDRVYTPPEGKTTVEVTIGTGAGTKAKLSASGTVDGKVTPTSCVVWNPHKEKAESMSDFGSDQYVDMICVEPGLLSDVPELEGGKECVFTQTITAI